VIEVQASEMAVEFNEVAPEGVNVEAGDVDSLQLGPERVVHLDVRGVAVDDVKTNGSVSESTSLIEEAVVELEIRSARQLQLKESAVGKA
jgi:hypothetical protein